MRWSFAEISTIVLIALLAAIDAALYGGVFRGYDPNAADARDTFLPPASVLRDAATGAEQDASPDLPGVFVPTQGRNHTAPYPTNEHVPFCPEGEVREDCYASIPPTSGLHLPAARGIASGLGPPVDIPPDPGVYTSGFPREAIPHLQEHAGVFVGYHCRTETCNALAGRMEAVVREELARGARVVMAPYYDLPENTIGLASWTRVDAFPIAEYTDERIRRFIEAHSCRFDPEGFCQ